MRVQLLSIQLLFLFPFIYGSNEDKDVSIKNYTITDVPDIMVDFNDSKSEDSINGDKTIVREVKTEERRLVKNGSQNQENVSRKTSTKLVVEIIIDILVVYASMMTMGMRKEKVGAMGNVIGHIRKINVRRGLL